jgi:hypothetical protein
MRSAKQHVQARLTPLIALVVKRRLGPAPRIASGSTATFSWSDAVVGLGIGISAAECSRAASTPSGRPAPIDDPL